MSKFIPDNQKHLTPLRWIRFAPQTVEKVPFNHIFVKGDALSCLPDEPLYSRCIRLVLIV